MTATLHPANVYPVTIFAAHITRAEADILLHRLDVPDAIADALTDCADGAQPVVWTDRQTTESRAIALADWIRAAFTDVDDPNESRRFFFRSPYNLQDVDREILIDCIEGATLPYIVADQFESGEITRQEFAAYCRRFSRLEKTISDAMGRQVLFPVA
jgi:hypothetical protein